MITITEQLDALVDLDSDQYRLSDWEVNFVDSVEKQVRAGRNITPKQAEKISAIYDAVFIHGKRGAR